MPVAGVIHSLIRIFIFSCVLNQDDVAGRSADAIEQNIETIKNLDEALILIQEPSKIPELFTTDKIKTWRFGTAEYYGKNKIRYYEEWDK